MNKVVMETIDSEVEFAKELWETLPKTERPLGDAQKPVEFWVMHIRRYLRSAEDACYSTDKIHALENIRKIAALCVRCMENNPTPPRRNG